ncbi:ketosynthase [Streptomyces sp. CNQ085]|uniref:ketosynthase n=1 Tax=Streptomyces sp. CNQ085 TaxID=2886944 RepID=UPI001F514C6C|nr:ketosynthase [Streptomyces sp. CNQ085]MCI0386304.1 ketosynthase [Streptomyces sp. CNQ085]
MTTSTTTVPASAHVIGAAAVTWPAEGGLPGVPGFIESRFNPLVKEVADRCIADAAPDGLGDSAGRTGVLLLTSFGDTTTTDLASRRLAAGQIHNPLLFYQSVPTSVLGLVTRDHNITGPICCLSVHEGSTPEAFETAELMLADDGIEQLLLIGVELAPSPRTTAARLGLQPHGVTVHPGSDEAVALLLGRERAPGTAWGTAVGTHPQDADRVPERDTPAAGPAHLRGLGALRAAARAWRTTRPDAGTPPEDPPSPRPRRDRTRAAPAAHARGSSPTA